MSGATEQTTEQTAAEVKHAYEAAILDQYEDEEERAAARATLESLAGIDLVTGMPTDDDESSADPDSASRQDDPSSDPTGSADADAAAQAAAAEAAKKEGEEEEGKTEPTAEEKAAQEAADEIARLRAENEELNRRVSAAALGQEIEQIANTERAKVAGELALGDDLTGQLDQVEEQYGEEAANPLKALKGKYESLAQRTAEAEAKVKAAEVRAERETQADQNTETERAISANEDINTWLNDARAAAQGDQTKSSAAWDLAVATDNALKVDPAWKDKGVSERMPEVARRVNLALGVKPDGAPETPSTEQAIQEEIARRAAAGKETDDAPTSITDLPGGDQPVTDITQKYGAMTTSEISDLVESGQLSIEQADQMIERMEAAGAF